MNEKYESCPPFEPHCLELMQKVQTYDKNDTYNSPYDYIDKTLKSIASIESEIPDNHMVYTTPSHVPGSTSVPYSQWYKKKKAESIFNQANTCLRMRITPQAQNYLK